jgi:competence protein ComEA
MKLAMLVATIGLVFWIGWQVPESSPKHEASADDSRSVPLRVSIAAEPETSRLDRLTAGPKAAKPGASHELSLGGRSASRGLLDLNRAEANDFESLPGIGAVLAQRVIAYRQSVGRFQTIEDLRAVKGIGAKTFERIRPLVTVVATDMKGKAEKRPL